MLFILTEFSPNFDLRLSQEMQQFRPYVLVESRWIKKNARKQVFFGMEQLYEAESQRHRSIRIKHNLRSLNIEIAVKGKPNLHL